MTSQPGTGLTPGGPRGALSHPTHAAEGSGTDQGAAGPTESQPRPTPDQRQPVFADTRSTAYAAPPTELEPGTTPAVAALAGDLAVERHRLSPTVVRYWRWRAVFSAFPAVLLLASLAYVVPWGPTWLRWGIVGAVVLLIGAAMVVLPPIRYQVFWYAISPTEIDIQHGVIFIKRSVVPMHRVQSLRTERGPMADHYRMTNLKIKSAAGSVNLSGLGRAEADDLCDRISHLADVADDV